VTVPPRILTALALAAALALPPAVGAQGRIVVDTLHSRALRGNLIGDTPDREVTIYLPPSYGRDSTRRYPVLYLLHGITSHPREWLDGTYQGFDLRRTMDSLARGGLPEFLVVMPFADNAYGGSFYVNSPAFGRWEDFVIGELVPYVDARFRTRASSPSRGLAGQSMGGFGALYLAGGHPEVFGYVYAMSPCCLGFVGDLAPESDVWAVAALDRTAIPKVRAGQMRIVRAMAAAFAPSWSADSRGPVIPFPFAADSSGGVRPNPPVLDAWRAHLPLDRLMRDARPYRRLRAVALEFGREDRVGSVPPGATAFAQALQAAGIPHTLEEYTGGHTDRARERFEIHLLPFFGHAFSGRHARP
jgi:enterochelin esterase-like enzyme